MSRFRHRKPTGPVVSLVAGLVLLGLLMMHGLSAGPGTGCGSMAMPGAMSGDMAAPAPGGLMWGPTPDLMSGAMMVAAVLPGPPAMAHQGHTCTPAPTRSLPVGWLLTLVAFAAVAASALSPLGPRRRRSWYGGRSPPWQRLNALLCISLT